MAGTLFQEAGHDSIVFAFITQIPNLKKETFLCSYLIAQRQGIVFFEDGNFWGFDSPVSFLGHHQKPTVFQQSKMDNVINNLRDIIQNAKLYSKEHTGQHSIQFLDLNEKQQKYINALYAGINNFTLKGLSSVANKSKDFVKKALNKKIIKGEMSDLKKKVKVPDAIIFYPKSKILDVAEIKFETLPQRATTAMEIISFTQYAHKYSGAFSLVISSEQFGKEYSFLSFGFTFGKRYKEYLDFLAETGANLYSFDLQRQGQNITHPKILFSKM
jgi:hypothetical protein